MTRAPAPARPRRTRGRSLRGALFPGDRRVWLTAGAVLGLGLMVILVALLLPRDYYTGTNSIRTRGFVVQAQQGDELCVRNLQVPAGTGRVQLQVNAVDAPMPALTGQLRLAGGEPSPPSRLAAEPTTGARTVTFAAPDRPESPEAVRGDFCVRSAGPIRYGGRAGPQVGAVPPTLNGKPIGDRVGVWFLPPEGEKSSLLSRAGDITERAALFRPAFVSPAFYWLLIVVWIPLLAYLAVRLLATASARTVRRLALSVGLLAFGNAAAWAFITPPFNSPDESEHFAYVQWFAETGEAVARPDTEPRLIYSNDQTLALDGVRLFSYLEGDDGRPPWLPSDEDHWRELRTEFERTHEGRAPPRDNGGGSTAATTSHSPAYYALVSPGYWAGSGGSTWDQLTGARLMSALFGVIAAICAFLVVREFVPRHPIPAAAAGLLVGFHPMFAFMSGSVNNDMGVNAAAAVVILLVVRGFRRGLTWRTGAALGVAVAIMPVLKGTGYALYPLLVLALLVMVVRRHGRSDLPGYAALAGAFLLTAVAWSLASAAFDQTAVTTPGGSAPGSTATTNPFGYLSYLWQVFLPPLPFMTDMFIFKWPFFNIYIERGWAAFGWYAIFFPTWVYVVILAVSFAVGLLGLRVLGRNRDRVRRDWPALLFVIAVPVVIVAAVEAAYWSPVPRPALAEFGRYLFPAMAALAAMAIGACFAFGRRWAPTAAAALVGAMLVLNYASQLLALAGFYA